MDSSPTADASSASPNIAGKDRNSPICKSSKPTGKANNSHLEQNQQRDKTCTMYIRKIPVSSEMEDIRSQLQRAEIPLKDIKISQTLPNCDFKGKWKFMICEGPATALQKITQAAQKRRLPWKINTAPPTRPGAFLDNQRTNPCERQYPVARPEIPFHHFNHQHRPHPHPSSLHLTHNSFVQDYTAPPFQPSQPNPTQIQHRHQGPPAPPLMGLWHQLQAQGRELANLQLRLGAPPLHTTPVNWGHLAW